MKEFPSGSPKDNEKETDRKALKLLELRRQIIKAGIFENEKEVLLLEQELRAVEKGEHFDRAAYLAEQQKVSKKEVLDKIQNFETTKNDVWKWDGTYDNDWNEDRTYAGYFKVLLEQAGYEDFEELVKKRSIELGRSLDVLDLFGGAYFLEDLENVGNLIGVRLENTDVRYAKERYPRVAELMKDPRRKILTGNLYERKTWNLIDEKIEANKSSGFDLITCRPQGPFGHNTGFGLGSPLDIKETGSTHRQEIYIALLNRTLRILSPEGGLLFVQQPVLSTHPDMAAEFWKRYVDEKKEEGYEFFFDTVEPGRSTRLAVRRSQTEIK